MQGHKHCKICGEVINAPEPLSYEINKAYKLNVCEKCIIKKGIEYFEKNNKPENLNYGKKQPSCQGNPTKIKSQ